MEKRLYFVLGDLFADAIAGAAAALAAHALIAPSWHPLLAMLSAWAAWVRSRLRSSPSSSCRFFGPAASGSAPAASAATEIYRREFDRALEEGTFLMLTFHPHIIGHRYRMDELQALISYMRSKPRVWFATAEQIAEYVKREAQLSAGNASSLSR